jgi:uncharacterized protein (TIGR03437 family)
MPLALWLGGLSVSVGGIPAPLYYAGPNLINFQVPYEIPPGFADVIVSVRGVQSAAEPVQVALTAPGLFMYGAGRAIVQNADYSLNTENNPAQVGAYVSVYMTGGGAVDNPPGTGRAAPLFPPSQFGAHVSATIGGVDAPVAFAGLTPGYAGLGQINLRVPTLPTGTYPVVITVGDRQTNSGDITVAR